MSVTYNIHPAFAVDDASLLETDLTTCQLLVLTGKGVFSYVVYNPAAKKFMALKSYTFQTQKGAVAELEMIEQVFDADKLLFTNFKAVYLAFDGGDCTVVPEKYYSPSLRKDYMELIYPEKTQEVILADILTEQHMVNIYGVDKDLLGYLRKEFSTDNTLHVNTALLKSYTYDNDYRDLNGVAFIDIQHHKFTLTVFKLGQLLSQQEIPCTTGLDVVYHLVNALRQTGLDEQHAKVKVGGALTADSQIYAELHRFIPKLEWMQRLPGFGYISKMQEIPAYYFNNLYALALCV
jgi:hypothetical protein